MEADRCCAKTGKAMTEVQEDAERLKGLRRIDELRRDFALASYRPYPKQRAFHAMGATKSERAFLAGNQLGKTLCASFEVACHMTGWYPDWWDGVRFDQPVRFGIGCTTAELTRDGAQRLLLGEFGKFGTGAIPKGNLLPDWKLSRGIPEAVDLFRVKHKSGGVSIAILKSYKDGRLAWQADTWDGCWLDEEPEEDIYSEAYSRVSKKVGTIILTATPMLGMSNVMRKFYPRPDTDDRGLVMMGIHEVKHFSEEQKRKRIAGYMAHERDARTQGIPMLGRGRVFPLSDESVSITPIQTIPPLWRRICGLDFGEDHPTAAAWMAIDDDADVVYVYDVYRRRREGSEAIGVPIHAAALRARGCDWIPVAWPRDGLNETAAGPQLAKQYRDQGINMLEEHAQYDVVPGDSKENPRLARNSVEAGVNDMLTRFETGKLKVYAHLNDFFEEFRMYHRKDGQIVKLNEDILCSVRYALMMLRFAQNNMKAQRVNANRGGNWRTL